LTNFGYCVAGWTTGFLIGLSVACCHLHTADTLRQRHVLAPLIAAAACALAYGLVGRALDSALRPDFELVAVSVAAGTGAAALLSACWPCSAMVLGAVALLVALGTSATLARSSFVQHDTAAHT